MDKDHLRQKNFLFAFEHLNFYHVPIAILIKKTYASPILILLKNPPQLVSSYSEFPQLACKFISKWLQSTQPKVKRWQYRFFQTYSL